LRTMELRASAPLGEQATECASAVDANPGTRVADQSDLTYVRAVNGLVAQAATDAVH
jgi:hypothetical protein